MIDIKQYRENARSNNLCGEYSEKWDGCKSDKQLIDMAMSAKGVDYLCDTISKGWGISPEYLAERFSTFINGRYVSGQNGYEAEMYCKYKGDVTADKTLLAIISSEVNIYIPDNNICEIYASKGSKIALSGKGRCVVICYGNPEDIEISGKCGNMKRINKKNRDNYGE